MYIGNLQATFASPDAAPTIRTENSNAIALIVAPGTEMLTNRPTILEEEVALPPASKEAVSVAFICNLRGFGCPYLRTRSRLHSGISVGCSLQKLVWKSASSSEEVCTTQEPG